MFHRASVIAAALGGHLPRHICSMELLTVSAQCHRFCSHPIFYSPLLFRRFNSGSNGFGVPRSWEGILHKDVGEDHCSCSETPPDVSVSIRDKRFIERATRARALRSGSMMGTLEGGTILWSRTFSTHATGSEVSGCKTGQGACVLTHLQI